MNEVEWKISQSPVAYPDAVSAMEERVAKIREGSAPELIWLLEHPPLYTAGTSAQSQDLISNHFPVYQTGRGGQYTYHGPGQRVVYVMLDLRKRFAQPDIKQYICNLEQWIINTLQQFDIKGERRSGRVGIWVDMRDAGLIKPDQTRHAGGGDAGLIKKESKIAAIGVRVRHWVTYHGLSINLNPDLSHFGGIVPCGIAEHGVTSFADLGMEDVTMEALDKALKDQSAAIGVNCADV